MPGTHGGKGELWSPDSACQAWCPQLHLRTSVSECLTRLPKCLSFMDGDTHWNHQSQTNTLLTFNSITIMDPHRGQHLPAWHVKHPTQSPWAQLQVGFSKLPDLHSTGHKACYRVPHARLAFHTWKSHCSEVSQSECTAWDINITHRQNKDVSIAPNGNYYIISY